MTRRAGTVAGGGAEGAGCRYGLGCAVRPGGGLGRLRGGNGSRPVDGMGGRPRSLRALLNMSNVLV